MVLRDIYETEYGIFRHIGNPTNRRPLASVAFHPSENINENSMLAESMRTFINKGIGDKFKISYTQFLELPTDVVALMLSVADEKASQVATEVSQIEREFGKFD